MTESPARAGAPPLLADRYQPRLALTRSLDTAVDQGGTAVLIADPGGVAPGSPRIAAGCGDLMGIAACLAGSVLVGDTVAL
jgi:hypothetical protein